MERGAAPRSGNGTAFFLIFLTCFQFLCNAAHIQQTALYLVINPYVAMFPLLFIWLAALGFYGHYADRNFLIAWLVLMTLQTLFLQTFSISPGFPVNLFKSLQFFWGPLVLIPIFLGLFRISGAPRDVTHTTHVYIKGLCWIASGISLFEIVAVRLLHVPALSLPWIHDLYVGIHRPFGLPDYPQPNAILLALLFWFSFLYQVPGNAHRVVTLVTLSLTLGITGVIIFLALIPLWTRRPFLFSGMGFAALGVLVATATLGAQYSTGGPLEKFDLAYLDRLGYLLNKVLRLYLVQFNTDNFLFGAPLISPLATSGISHDWAYFDVFYVYGFVGVAAYILLYGLVSYLACPSSATVSMRLYFVLVVLIANFHYGTLNYYVGQFLFSTLAALRIRDMYPIPNRAPSRASPAGLPAMES